jgi:hypothetical protein
MWWTDLDYTYAAACYVYLWHVLAVCVPNAIIQVGFLLLDTHVSKCKCIMCPLTT